MLFWKRESRIFPNFQSSHNPEYAAMSQEKIYINGKAFSIDKIVRREIPANDQDAFTAGICEFVSDWLNGEDTFSLTTSGSTGEPAVIKIGRAQMTASARNTLSFFNLQPGDRALLCLNPAFIAGKMMIIRAFVGNLVLHAITPSTNPLNMLDEHAGFEFAAFTPHQLYESLLRSPQKTGILNRMKAIIVGGGPVGSSLWDLVEQLSAPVYSTYGMTETVSHVALQRINGRDRRDYYEAVGDARFDVDERDCLTVSGWVTNGKTLITNDIVELISETKFKWLGRADNALNSGGIKIAVEQLEQKIEAILVEKGIRSRFFIFGMPDPALGQKVCLAIEGNAPDQLISGIIETVVNKYERPRQVFRFDRFAETATGKIDRRKTISTSPLT